MSKEPNVSVVPFNPDDPNIDASVTDMVLLQGVLAVMNNCVSRSIKAGWDLPPQVGPVYLQGRSPLDPDLDTAVLGMSWDQVPQLGWQLGSLKEKHLLLGRLGESVRADSAFECPDHLVAFLIIVEGWMVRVAKEDAHSLDLEVAERRLHSHPNRVEMKTALAVDLNGTSYSVITERNGPTMYQAGPIHSKLGAGGTLTTALDYLVKAMTGKQLPDYQDYLDASPHGEK